MALVSRVWLPIVTWGLIIAYHALVVFSGNKWATLREDALSREIERERQSTLGAAEKPKLRK